MLFILLVKWMIYIYRFDFDWYNATFYFILFEHNVMGCCFLMCTLQYNLIVGMSRNKWITLFYCCYCCCAYLIKVNYSVHYNVYLGGTQSDISLSVYVSIKWFVVTTLWYRLAALSSFFLELKSLIELRSAVKTVCIKI